MYYVEVKFIENKLAVGIYNTEHNYFDWQERNSFNIKSKIVSVNTPKSHNKKDEYIIADSQDNLVDSLPEARKKCIEILFGEKYEK